MRVRIAFVLMAALFAERALAERPIVAVFAIEDRDTKLPARTIANLSEYLGAKLGATGQYEIIATNDMKSRLQNQKADSYKSCFDQSCQVELGKELAAQKSLATKLIRIGKKCVITASLFDLKKATTEIAATAEAPCTEEGVMGAFDKLVADLSAVKIAKVEPQPNKRDPSSNALDPNVFANWRSLGGTWVEQDGGFVGTGGTLQFQDVFADGEIECDVEFLNGNRVPATSVGWRAAYGRGYGVNYQWTGAYNAFVGTNNDWKTITSNWTAGNQAYKPSSLIDDTKNHIRIEFEGPAWRAFFNGKLLDSGSDTTHTSGKFQLWVEDANTQTKFSNFRVVKKR